MKKAKSRTRWTDFFHSVLPQTSPRASFILSKKDLSTRLFDSARSSKIGKSKSFEVFGLNKFESGYNLENLPGNGFQDFYGNVGINYVRGVIKRFKDENKIFKPKAYREAILFKEAYKAPKIL